jgi:hypothetical protein
MADFSIKASLEAIASHFAASGHFKGGVQIGEYASPPTAQGAAGMAMAVWFESINIILMVASGQTRERHGVVARIYRASDQQPPADVESDIAFAASQVMGDIVGDYTLGSEILEVDIAGIYGEGMRADAGRVEVGGVWYRTVDITLPLLVDASATAAP